MLNNGMENALTKIEFKKLEDIPSHLREFFEPINIDHFAIFPQDLVEIPIKFGCPSGGIVLDPFMGSGTTAVVARSLGRNYIGIELSAEYCKIAEKRLLQEILF